MNVSANTFSWIQSCRFRYRSRIIWVVQCDTVTSDNYKIYHDARNRHLWRSFSQLTRFREYETWKCCPNLRLRCWCLRQGASEVHGYLAVSGGRQSFNHPSNSLPYLLHLCTVHYVQYHWTPRCNCGYPNPWVLPLRRRHLMKSIGTWRRARVDACILMLHFNIDQRLHRKIEDQQTIPKIEMIS